MGSPGGPIYGVPDLPPRIDRGSKPPGTHPIIPPTTTLNSPSNRNPSSSSGAGTYGRSAQERLFGTTKNLDNSEHLQEGNLLL